VSTDNWVRGHKEGYENWRLNKMAEEHNMTQAQFNDFVRTNTDKIYHVENKKDNASHAGEDKKPLASGEEKGTIDTMMENHCENLSCGKPE